MQVANTVINLDQTGSPATATLVPDYARKGEARWRESSLPEVGRKTMVYTRRDPVQGSDLVKHSFRVTLPTLRNIVTDPSGPYEPAPVADYVGVVELSLWVHPRATLAERDALVAAFLRPTASLEAAVEEAASGGSFY